MRLTNLKHISFVAAAGLFVAGTVTLHAQTPNGGAGPRPVAILLCQYPDKPDTYGFKPADILATWMSNTLMVNGAPVDNSINGLVQEASGGTVNFQGTQAFGWFTLPNPFSSYATGYDAGNDCIATAQSKGVNLTPFVYAAIYMNDKLADAMGESWPATLPTASPTGAHALIVSYAGLVSPPLVLHELGHILSTGGQHTDSGSDPLGAASWLGSLGTPPNLTTVAPEWDASRRELMGFIPSVATFSGGTQTYNLSRLTQPYPGLPSAIDVPLPNGAKYVISARTYIGHDAFLTYTLPNQWGWSGNHSMGPEGVKIELFTSTRVDAHIQTSAPIQAPWDAGSVWLTGQTFTDSANGIAITVVNFNSTANPTAQITVSSTASTNALPPGSWQTQPGSLIQISAGSDGTVIGVNGQNQILQWTGQSFTQMPGAAVNVAVASSTKTFAWNGNSMYTWNGTAWSQGPALPAGITGVSWMAAAGDGTLYAVDITGNVNRLDAVSNTWSVVGSNAGHVAAKNSSVFYMLQSGSGTLPAGTIQMVSGATTTTLPGNLNDITVDSAGDLWGVNGNNTVYHWNGTYWDQEPGTFTQIAVGNPTTLWAVNANAQGAVAQWH